MIVMADNAIHSKASIQEKRPVGVVVVVLVVNRKQMNKMKQTEINHVVVVVVLPYVIM